MLYGSFSGDFSDADDTAASLFIGLNDFGQFGLISPGASVEDAIAFATVVHS